MPLDVEIVAGQVRAVPVPVTSVDTPILNGPLVLCGWSLREASGDLSREASGSANAPVAGTVIAQLTAIVAGTYKVVWTVGLSGTLSVADANNFALLNNGVQVTASLNLAVTGEYPQVEVTIPVASGTTVSIVAIGNATAASVYAAELSITASTTADMVAEIRDGNQVVACIGLGVGQADTQYFGARGLTPMNTVILHVVSGAVTGAIYLLYDN